MPAKRPGSPLSPPPLGRKKQSTTTNKAVASFFKPASQKEAQRLRWRIANKSLIVGKFAEELVEGSIPENSPSSPQKIAAFDLDDSLVSPSLGNKWSRSASGWKWWHRTIPAKLKELHSEGFRIIILSNQSTINLKESPKLVQKDSVSLANFKSQLATILQQLDLPISVYAATGQDIYRKPRVGMWKAMLEDHDLDGPGKVDQTASFFVGDAAGRENLPRRLKDHACSDRDFAANVGIRFYTPEETFLNAEPDPFAREFEPTRFLKSAVNNETAALNDIEYQKANAQDIVLHCGSPGAGKSTFFWKKLEPLGYERVNQDILKTREKCLKTAKEHLNAGRSVAVEDNTNANTEVRASWIELAQAFEIPIRCVHFTASTRLCEHNDTVRALNPTLMNPENRSILPALAFRSFASRYVKPTLSEGFQDIINVDFVFDGTPEQQRIWSQFWVSKFST